MIVPGLLLVSSLSSTDVIGMPPDAFLTASLICVMAEEVPSVAIMSIGSVFTMGIMILLIPMIAVGIAIGTGYIPLDYVR